MVTKHYGLPRTAKAADERGYKKKKIDFKNMPSKEKKNWIHLAYSGARKGSLGLVRKGPGSTPGTSIVCYLDASTGEYTDCREVPDGENIHMP